MLKLTECREGDARWIADRLRKAGIKVELKPFIDASTETEEFLQGRLSELKSDIRDEGIIEKYERYIDVIKKVLGSKPSPEEFQEMYTKELMPSIDEARAKIRAILEPGEQENRSKASGDQISQTEESEESAALNKKMKDVISDTVKIIAEGEKIKHFISSILFLNDIVVGEDIGSRLDDPIVDIPVDLDEYGNDHPRAKSVLSVYLDKYYELYIDEFSTLHSDRLDDEFIKRYTDEHLKIASLSYLLSDLIENHTSEKMDLETFEDECFFMAESGNRSLRVVGYSIAEEIAKVLEKNGIIKIKGDTIRWKN